MWFNRLDIGDIRLAPRPRYSIEKIEFTPNLNSDTGNQDTCAATDGCSSGPIKDWDIVITIHCLGNGDWTAANRFYRNLSNDLKVICGSNKEPFVLQYCEEDPLQYQVTSAYIKPINTDWAPSCCGENTTMSGEIHLKAEETQADEADIVLYNYSAIAS